MPPVVMLPPYRMVSPTRNRGFSMVELLTVLAVISALSIISMPAFLSLSKAMGFGDGIYNVSGAIEQARSHAMAHGTYVWIALTPKSDQSGKPDGFFISLFSSADRTSELNAENLLSISRPLKISGAQFATIGDNVLANRFLGEGLVQVGEKPGAGQTKPPQASDLVHPNSNLTLLRVDPRGSVTTRNTSEDAWQTFRWLEIGLAENRRRNSPSPNLSAIQISGLTGQVLVFR